MKACGTVVYGTRGLELSMVPFSLGILGQMTGLGILGQVTGLGILGQVTDTPQQATLCVLFNGQQPSAVDLRLGGCGHFVHVQ